MSNCRHYVSTCRSAREIKIALDYIAEPHNWAMIKKAAGADASRCDEALARMRDGIDLPEHAASWSVYQCLDDTFLLEAVRAARMPDAVERAIDDCVEAMASAYWNGEAACENSECDRRDR